MTRNPAAKAVTSEPDSEGEDGSSSATDGENAFADTKRAKQRVMVQIPLDREVVDRLEMIDQRYCAYFINELLRLWLMIDREDE